MTVVCVSVIGMTEFMVFIFQDYGWILTSKVSEGLSRRSLFVTKDASTMKHSVRRRDTCYGNHSAKNLHKTRRNQVLQV